MRDEIQNKFIKFFDNIDSLFLYAKHSEDYDIMKTVQTVRKHGGNIPILINEIKDKEVPQKYAAVVLVTGHKSKGLEWDSVFIAKDFARGFDSKLDEDVITSEEIIQKLNDEYNLLYVACTRAQRHLSVHADVATLIDSLSQIAQEKLKGE